MSISNKEMKKYCKENGFDYSDENKSTFVSTQLYWECCNNYNNFRTALSFVSNEIEYKMVFYLKQRNCKSKKKISFDLTMDLFEKITNLMKDKSESTLTLWFDMKSGNDDKLYHLHYKESSSGPLTKLIISNRMIPCPKCKKVKAYKSFIDNCGCIQRDKEKEIQKGLHKQTKEWGRNFQKVQKESNIPGMMCINVGDGKGYQTKFIDVSAIKGVTINAIEPETDKNWKTTTEIKLICDPDELSQSWKFTSEEPKNQDALKFYKNLLKEITVVRE